VDLAHDVVPVFGSLAPSETACVAAMPATPKITPEGEQRHDQRGRGAAELPGLEAPHRRRGKNESRIATATGISTSLAR